MTVTPKGLVLAALFCVAALSTSAQTLNAPAEVKTPVPIAPSEAAAIPVPTVSITPAVQLLSEFKESEVKFRLDDLMETLRDRRHEGWVLAAYPDPKTGRPLIGAGFSLDLPAREHIQRDPLNPHPFLEPSSAELWQAAGLDQERLARILDQYEDRLSRLGTKKLRKQIKTLSPDIEDQDANALLRVAAIQSIYNARAYCRSFDALTASQQMALSQLVYQMGVNLEEFSTFLALINNNSLPSVHQGGDPTAQPVALTAPAPAVGTGEYWKSVQQSLIQSQWARLYRTRAIAVVAMLDPKYGDDPRVAERRVGAVLRPAVVRRRGNHTATTRRASAAGRRSAGRKHGHGRSRRKA